MIASLHKIAWCCIAFSIGCGGEPQPNPWTIPTLEPPGSPAVGNRVIWRPFVDTCEGSFDSGNIHATAFVLQGEGWRPALITSLSLLTQASGLARDLELDELCGCVTGTYVSDAFGASDSLNKLGAVIAFPPSSSVVDATDWARWGLLAIEPLRLKASSLQPSDTPVEIGQRIWLVTAVYGGAPASQKCHEAIIQSLGDAGELTYKFSNSELSLQAAAGAPLLNDLGELVGVHHDGNNEGNIVLGRGVGGPSLWQSLAILLKDGST